jgi:valine dehydrogenase (NAD+)
LPFDSDERRERTTLELGHTTPRDPHFATHPRGATREALVMSADPSVPVPVPAPGSVDPVDVFELGAEHEQVVFCNDPATGLKAIVAIHSTALGPALGGTRFYPYASTADAVRDVLNLSRGMSYKAALAGLDLGGGKAVIIGDPIKDKNEALLRAYGRFVQSLNGRYFTACDVGTFSADMDIVARECAFVTGRTVAHGGAGDSSVLTAYGVYQGMRASAEALWGSPSLGGRTVGIAGVGKVGHHLVKHVIDEGAKVVVTDVHPPSVEAMVKEYGAGTAADSDALVRADIDIYAPCAMGGALTDEVVDVLTAKIVCGAANNQLSHPGIEKALADRGILYAPDYCVNSGGLIQVADELEGFSFERAEQRASGIYETTKAVFELARTDAVTPAEAADRLAERRMRDVGRLRGMWLPTR